MNYLNISNEAQALLSEISKKKDGSPAITVCQTQELGENVGLHQPKINAASHELQDVGIVKIEGSGKTMYLDSVHIEEFQRQFPSNT